MKTTNTAAAENIARTILAHNPRMHIDDKETVEGYLACGAFERARAAALIGAARQRTQAEYETDMCDALQNFSTCDDEPQF